MKEILEILNVIPSKDAKELIIFHKGEIYKYLDCGLTRNVYVNADKTQVIKVNIGEDYVDWNKQELDIYKKSNQKDKMAKTWIDSGYLIQEYLRPIEKDDYKILSDYLFVRSCRNECGVDIDGNIKVYDLFEMCKY